MFYKKIFEFEDSCKDNGSKLVLLNFSLNYSIIQKKIYK